MSTTTLPPEPAEPKAEEPLEPSPAASDLPEIRVCAFDDREICLLGLSSGTDDEP